MIGEEATSVQSETDQLREQLLRAQRLSSVGTLASSVAHPVGFHLRGGKASSLRMTGS